MQSIDRLFAVVQDVADHPGGVGMMDIATATGLAPATCHRLLGSLQEAHLLERDPVSKQYRPGVGLLRLAISIMSGHYAPSIDTALAALRDRWQECFFIAALVDNTILSVRTVATNDPNRINVSVPVGRRMRPHASASGKAVVAFLDRVQRDAVVAAGGFERLTEHTISDKKTLERELARCREEGFAVCDQETEIGVTAYAAPIIDVNGAVRTSLGAIGPRERLRAARERGLLDDLQATARFMAGVQVHVPAWELPDDPSAVSQPKDGSARNALAGIGESPQPRSRSTALKARPT